ncbi:MAG: M3 family metallopeptidase [Usitatibacter sp.]
MRTCIALAVLAVALPAAAAKFVQPKRPLMPVYTTPAALTKACEKAMANTRRHVALMERKVGGAGLFNEWNQLQIIIDDVLGPIYLLGEASPDKTVRDAAEPCLTKFTALTTEIFQNEKLYKRVQAAKPANPHQAKLRKDVIEGFEDSGVALPKEKRARAKQIFDLLEALRQGFDRNVRDDPTRVTFTAAEMEGLPEAYLRAQEKNVDKDGNYVLRLSSPSYVPFMENAKSGEARKKYFIAKFNEGGKQNLDQLEEIFRLRKELAALYDLPTFAHFSLRRKMTGKPEVVEKFLADVKGAVTELEKKELEELRLEKAKELGEPQVKLERWDSAYYQEKVRRTRFAVDQEKLRRYFPTEKAIEYTLLVSQRLYGVKFQRVKVPVWNPDVRYYDVVDAKTGAFISGFYLDLFPREGKYAHAAAFPLRGVSVIAKRTPLTALEANLNAEGLDLEEMETLLHEFGHVLHGVLSKTDYISHAGTSVKNDFAEAPSMMYQEWAKREQPLALFKEVCAECPQLTREELAQLQAARRFGQGIRYGRQWLYAAFDMALSTNPRPPLAVWKEMESATPLGYVEGTIFPASFAHIASNYAAGYYGYMWAEVLALDMLSVFKGDLMNPAIGMKYRETILSQGGQEEEMDLVRRFLGREPSSDAFFAEITGKR